MKVLLNPFTSAVDDTKIISMIIKGNYKRGQTDNPSIVTAITDIHKLY